MDTLTANTNENTAVRARLVAQGGRLAQDFGFNRVAGEVLVCLYLTPGEASLDDLEAQLDLSKASVSLAAAQLERLGLVRRVRKAGDRNAEDFGKALRHGILTFARGKLAALGTELDEAEIELKQAPKGADAKFLSARVRRLRDLNRRAARLVDNPLVNLFSK